MTRELMPERVVAVAGGTGGLGHFITQALLESKEFAVVILSREGASSDSGKACMVKDLVARGARIVGVDYSAAGSLKAGLRGVDTLISALTTSAAGAEQILLADAAKAAGVRLFIPSEFGVDTTIPANTVNPAIAAKVKVAEHCIKIGLPTQRIMSGFFIDTFFTPFFDVDLKAGTASLVGPGTSKVSFTHRRDVGRYTAQLLKEGVEDEVVRLSAVTCTLDDAFAKFEGVTGRRVRVLYESTDRAKERIAKGGEPWPVALAFLKLAAAEGRGLNKDPYSTHAFQPVTLEEFFADFK